MKNIKNGNTIEAERLLTLAKHLGRGRLYERNENSPSLPQLSVHQSGETIRYYDFPFLECVHLFKEWGFSEDGEPVLSAVSRATVVDSALDFFNLSSYAFQHLFSPNSQYPDVYGGRELERDASVRDIAFNIRSFVQKQKNKLLKMAA